MLIISQDDVLWHDHDQIKQAQQAQAQVKLAHVQSHHKIQYTKVASHRPAHMSARSSEN